MPRNYTQVRPNLRVYEVSCNCGCGFGDTHGYVPDQILDLFQLLRDELGVLRVNSWCRCTKHNEAVGGAERSKHLYGLAFDIVSPTHTPEEVAKVAKEITGVSTIIYDTFTHVDLRTLLGHSVYHADRR